MSATARDFVYEVCVTKDSPKKPVPIVGSQKMAEYKANVEKYLDKKDAKEN